MRKVQRKSKKGVSDTKQTEGRANSSRRKSKGPDKERSEPEIQNVRRQQGEQVVESTKELSNIENGDKFYFISPGKGKKKYTCIVEGNQIYFERDDKYNFKRNKNDFKEMVTRYKIECIKL